MLYRLFLRLTLVVFIASSITACGGGGGSSDSPEPTRSPAPTPAPAPTPTPAPAPPPPQDNGNDGDGQNDTVHIVSGSGVKGPLANAMVRVYEVDPNQSDFRGTLIAESSTDNQAKIENLEVSDSLAGPFIIEFTAVDETVDLSTGIAPFLGTLSTIVTKTEISSEQPIYATPLTTIVEKLIAAGAGSALLGGNENGTIDTDEVIDAIASAEAIVRSTFGFGISDQVNILTTPAIIDGPISSEQLSAIAEYRAAAEGFASVISYLSQRNTSQIDTDTIVSDLARDLADGVLDGSFGERSTSSYDLDDLVSQSNLLNDLSIDSIDGTRTVDDIVQILLDERSATGFTDVTVSGFQSIQGPFLVAPIALAADIDGDGVFNSVDLDDDGDSVADTLDAFPHDETESVDTDNDGIGNNRDTDDDGDGIPDANDDFPLDASQQENNDQDNDGVEDIFDAFPNDASESHDLDGDGIGDNTDDDIDGDGVANSIDVFPYNSNETIDTDNDGVGNNTDTDDDNDGVSDNLDAFPLDASEVTDTDGDGVGNNADSDDDNDGVPDSSDAFPLDSLASVFNDADGDGWPVGQDDDDSNPNSPTIAFIDPDQDGLASDGGLAPDDDDDNDGVPDTFDWAPNDPSEWSDVDGDSIGDNADSDKDGDGFENSEDKFPSNPEEWADTDNDGIGDNEDSDADNDGIDNDVDAFPLDSTEWSDNDNDGIGNNADNDDDNDGVDDSIDAFPFDPNESADFDGDGIGNNEDNDDDNDNVIDTEDAFPFNQNESKDTDGDGIGDNEDNNSEIDDGSSNTVSEPSPLPPPPESETVSISGAGVKGPMAFADVALYRLDMSKNDYKGDVIGTTSTNEFAQIIDLSLPSDETPPFLMEIKGVEGSTIDISTDLYPVIDELRTLITQQMLDDGISIYATPLTTMATDMALSSADSNVSPFGGNQDGVATTEEVLAAIPVAAERVKSTLGFGIDENVELFTTPPVIDADTKSDSDKASAAALRSAVEAVTAIIYEMKQSGNSSSTTNDILVDLTTDLADGEIDGRADGQQTSSYSTDSLEVFTRDPATLRIPNTNSTVDDINTLIVDEMSAIGNNSEDTSTRDRSRRFFTIKPAETNVDKDNDGVANSADAFPKDASADSDFDDDGIPDIAYILKNGRRTSAVDATRSDNDDDNDGVLDTEDAFPLDATEQFDTDSDGIGNNADDDDDGDGTPDVNDDFPLDASRQVSTDRDNDGWPVGQDTNDNDASVPTIAWKDSDRDGFADEGGLQPDDDDDNDGVKDTDDAFPTDASESRDLDGDGIGNNSDDDIDGDGVINTDDAFPYNINETIDTDGDGIGNNRDKDDDGDGIKDADDAFPLNSKEHIDTDGDGIGNNADNDDDNDGVIDSLDWAPEDPTESKDLDGDSIGDNADPDRDGDGFANSVDKFPYNPKEWADTDNDGIGNNSDSDADGDNVANHEDAFPLDPNETTDTDFDGLGDNSDDFPRNRNLQRGTPISELSIVDKSLKQCLLDSNNKTVFAESIKTLNCSNRSITDLSGIEQLVQLSTVYLEGIKSISDYSPLASLNALENVKVKNSGFDNKALVAFKNHPTLSHIDASGADITNISAASSIPSLRSLYLWGDAVYDIGVLRVLPNFEQLALNSRQVKEVSDLADLTGLKTLWLHGDLTSDAKSAVLSLSKLQFLSVGYSTTIDDGFFTDIAKTLGELVWLNLDKSAVTSIEGIDSLSKLTQLSIANNDQLSDLSPILNNTKLSIPLNSLNVDGLSLTDVLQVTAIQKQGVSVIGDVTRILDSSLFKDAELTKCVQSAGSSVVSAIKSLNCADRKITNLSGIEQLSELTHINLKGISGIKDYSPLAAIDSLEYLEVADSDFNNAALAAFENHPSLSHIGADCTLISDISSAAKIPNLQSMHLRSEKAYDISVLKGSLNLETLVLGSHQVKDAFALTELPNLRNLWLKGDLTADAKSAILLLTGLERLAVGFSNTVDDTFFKDITTTLVGLKTLNVHKAAITTVAGVDDLNQLAELVIADNQSISDLSPLISRGNLTVPLYLLNAERLTSLNDPEQLSAIEALVKDAASGAINGVCSINSELSIQTATDDGTNDGNVPAGAIDGNLSPSSRWSSFGAGKQITFDLGATANVSEIRLAWFKGNERIAYFNVDASVDNKTWTPVLTSGQTSGKTLGLEKFELLENEVRYVRVTGQGNSAHLWNSIVEAKVYGCR